MQEEIRIEIDETGKIKYEVRGIKGKTCKEITTFLDELGTITGSGLTNDYYKKNEQPAFIKVTL